MQFQADIIGRPVQRSDSADLSALGAAYLAGLATGLWQTEAEIEALAQHGRRFEPHMAAWGATTRCTTAGSRPWSAPCCT